MSADWYYAANGQQTGPVELQTLRQMLVAGSLSRADLVFGPGLAQWTPAGQVLALGATNVEGISTAYAGSGGASASMLGYRGVETAATGLSDVAMNSLRQTKPWARFIGIMAFIGAGFMVLGGVAMLGMGALLSGRGRPVFPAWIGGRYIGLAVLYIIPGVLLNRYASAIGSLLQTQRMSDLESALGAQKSFWKFMGISVIVVIGLYIAFFFAFVVLRIRL